MKTTGRTHLGPWAAALLLLVPLKAVAEEAPGWHGGRTAAGVRLYYGIPQSDHAPVSFTCAPGGKGLTFVFAAGRNDSVDSAAVELRLRAGGVEVPIQTTAMYADMDTFVFEGKTILDDRLVALITSGETLAILTGDGVEAFPLAGAGEAAAPLLEACAGQAVEAAMADATLCRVYGWSTDPDPEGLNVRSGPGASHPVIGRLPPPQDIEGERFATEVSITGSRDGWFRIDQATINNYIVDFGPDVVFEGEGWVSGRHLGLSVEANRLFAEPSAEASVVLDVQKWSEGRSLSPEDLSHRLRRLHACMGNWVDVEVSIAGERFRGWTSDVCASQVTTCP